MGHDSKNVEKENIRFHSKIELTLIWCDTHTIYAQLCIFKRFHDSCKIQYGCIYEYASLGPPRGWREGWKPWYTNPEQGLVYLTPIIWIAPLQTPILLLARYSTFIQPKLKTLEWWILRLMLDPLFFLISRLT